MVDVSVILLVYNQELFVERAVRSILEQVFKGTIEVFISDDSSSDGSVLEIKKVVDQFKESNVKINVNTTNLGLAKHWEYAFRRAKGKYIAYLEGDDYWTDPYKIQKQFDALELNLDYSLAFHDFVYVDRNSKIISDTNLKKGCLKKNRTVSEMISGCLIHQNTIMFRQSFQKLPIWFFLARNHDTWLLAYLSNWGPAIYVDCSPLHYRILDNSLWSSLSPRKKHLNGLVSILTIFPVVPIGYFPKLFRKLGSKVFQIIKLSFK